MTGASSNSIGWAFWAQFAGLLLAASVLGVIYNNASPLRVPEILPDDARPIPPAAISSNPSNLPKGVHNGTNSLNFSPTTAVAPPASPAPVPAAVATGTLTIPALKWPEVKALLDAGKIILVDARQPANYDLGHIPGAILLPATSSAEELQAFATKYPRATAFVTYCGSDSCHVAHQLAEVLIKVCGYTDVSELPGGYAEYTIAKATGK